MFAKNLKKNLKVFHNDSENKKFIDILYTFYVKNRIFFYLKHNSQS